MIEPTDESRRFHAASAAEESAPKHSALVPWESIDPSEEQSTVTIRSESGRGRESGPSGIFVEPISSSEPSPVTNSQATVVLEVRESGELVVISPAPDQSNARQALNPDDEDRDGGQSDPLSYEPHSPPALDGGGWTIAILCIGLALIAACVLIPQADANRRLVYEREKLRRDLDQINRQSAVNQEFLAKIQNDPQLAERLAQRQMRMVRQGATVLDLHSDRALPQGAAASASLDAEQMSPFMIVHVPAPPPLEAYKPVGGLLATLCRQPHSQLYLLGAGMLMVATGLVLGDSGKK